MSERPRRKPSQDRRFVIPTAAPAAPAVRRAGQRGFGPRFHAAIVAGWNFATRQTPVGQRGYAWRTDGLTWTETPLFPLGDGAAVSPDAATGEHYCHVITWLEGQGLT